MDYAFDKFSTQADMFHHDCTCKYMYIMFKKLDDHCVLSALICMEFGVTHLLKSEINTHPHSNILRR